MLSVGPQTAKNPWCFCKAGCSVVFAGVAIRMLVVKGTSGGFKSGSRVPASLEGGTSGCWGRPRAGEM